MIFLSLLGGIHVSFHIFMFCSVPTLQIHPLSKFWTPANVLYHVFEVEAFKMSSSEKYFAPRTRVHKYSGFWISRQQCFANIAKLELRRHLKPISHILFKIDIFHHAIQYFFFFKSSSPTVPSERRDLTSDCLPNSQGQIKHRYSIRWVCLCHNF